MSVSLVWAQAVDGTIGDAGTIPWHLPEDLARFKELTLGSTVVMGRRTWDSLPTRYRPLSGRRNLVVTRDPEWSAEGAEVAHSLEVALAPDGTEAQALWVIGGGEIYRQALPLASRLEVTEVEVDTPGDTRAPLIDTSWSLESQTEWLASRAGLRYRFSSYTR